MKIKLALHVTIPHTLYNELAERNKMKATYENNSEYSCMTIAIREGEQDKAESVAFKLASFGNWGVAHIDSEMILLSATHKMTISEMKEDYREAKKAA